MVKISSLICFRSNLVELPTSYISNNCQMPSNIVVPKNDFDCLKSLKPYDHSTTFNSFDLKNTIENFESMESKNKILQNGKVVGKSSPHKVEPALALSTLLKSNGFHAPKSRILSDNRDLQNTNCYSDGPRLNTTNCKEYCQLAEFKGHDIDSQKPLCYDTDTYFNRPVDKERYSREVDYLREKLKILQNSAYINHVSPEVSIVNLDTGKGDSLRESFITASMEIKHKIIKKPLPAQPVKTTKSKISLKTRKSNVNKAKKVKCKNGNAVSDNQLG